MQNIHFVAYFLKFSGFIFFSEKMDQIKVFDDQFKNLIGNHVQCVYFENMQNIGKKNVFKCEIKLFVF